MMTLTPQTKIGAILKQHPDALESVVSLSPRFEKLRNPLLRKLIAGRTTLAEAARMGGCTLHDFYRKLLPLGFSIGEMNAEEATSDTVVKPKFPVEKIVDLDVRASLAAGTDPLQMILAKIKTLKEDEVLKIINTFEPTPLMHLLKKKGWQSYTDKVSMDLFHTFFYRGGNSTAEPNATPANSTAASDWDFVEKQFASQKVTIDVRHLEMPQPMLTILENLETLPAAHALYVYHKRIPVYLLQELKDREFDYRIKEVEDGDVRLLIFKNQ